MLPSFVPNLIAGEHHLAADGKSLEKFSPHSGDKLFHFARSSTPEVTKAVAAAHAAQPGWASLPGVRRGAILQEIVDGLKARLNDVAEIVAAETGKSLKDAKGETEAAISLGSFYASEGQRLYARTTTSGVENRMIIHTREAIGVAGLIIAANTPIANVAWKVFPALICGNAVVLKSAEDTPATAWIFGDITRKTSLPKGCLNIIHGLGHEAGAALASSPGVNVLSFTGSTAAGKMVHAAASQRLARLSLELGGKNALVVCDDADLAKAVRWTVLSAFSNAGQRCAAASRILVFEKVYSKFRQLLLDAVSKLKVGPADEDDFGPVINKKQLADMLDAIERAPRFGGKIIAGGTRLEDPSHEKGCYLSATLIENVKPTSPLWQEELFGPIAILNSVADFEAAISAANDSPYGLTAAIHTRNINRAMEFAKRVQTGVISINGGTYGSEPHLPFGGTKMSGNGSREPGTEALDIYSELKNIMLNIDPADLGPSA